MPKCIAVNAGSSSLKYKLFEMPEEKVLCSGIAERIGHEDGIFTIKFGDEKHTDILPLPDHGVAVDLLLKALIKWGIVKDLKEIVCVGHRVVQGGKYFSKWADFTDDTIEKITKLIPLDPLHAPAHLTGYRAFAEALPGVPEIAVFDTAFHQTMEPEDYLYPIPYEMSEKYDCRRYGAHGTSHNYLQDKAKKDYFADKEHVNIITCHIGSGASLAAIRDGKCVATSMGLTPLGGVMMGTRTGDLDPSVMSYLCDCTGMNAEQIYDIFNKKSGFLGVSGVSNDSRDVEAAAAAGNPRAILAIKMFARTISNFIGQYFVRLGHVDMIVFSAGMGENAPEMRELVLKEVEEALGLSIDYELNKKIRGKQALLSKPDSKILVTVIPTDEEVMIARDCYERIAQ
ncbi:MAG: acetate kinase [Candidatus Enteromonas sp.]|nr:acetate kinase [Candidatus Enteromonas sp.]